MPNLYGFRFGMINKKFIYLQLITCVLVAFSATCAAWSKSDMLGITMQQAFTSDSTQGWHNAMLIPAHSDQLVVLNKKRELLLANINDKTPNVLIDFTKQNKNILSVDNIAFNPNFHLADQTGYLTFYIAHLETANDNQRLARIPSKTSEALPFEAVITEWKLEKKQNTFHVDTASKRELVRVKVPEKDAGIRHIGFNPFIKNWQKSFGLLHFTLPKVTNFEQHSLFSGSLLRINPIGFGLKAYTIPAENNFLFDDDIQNEVVASGLGNIDQLIWLKEEVDKFALTDGNSLTITKLGEDWRSEKKPQAKALSIKSNIVYFRNSLFNNDNMPFVFFTQSDDNWQLQAMSISSNSTPSAVAKISSASIPLESKTLLMPRANGELLLLDLNKQLLFKVSGIPGKKQPETNKMAQEPEENESNNTLTFVVLLVATLAGVFWFGQKNDKYKQAKKLLRNNYARFDIDKENEQLHFYQRHQDTIDKSINISAVIRSEVYLNDEGVSLIDDCTPFSNKAELALNNAFKEEKRHKMVDDKIRKVVLVLQLKSNQVETLCLYLREGNQRLTKMRFEQVQEHLLSWNWLFSHQIAAEATEKRVVRSKAIRTAPKVQRTNKPTKSTTAPAQEPVQQASTTPQVSTQASVQNNDEALIQALNKLLELKTQGFLTEEEFANSKAKIIAEFSKQ